MDPEDAIKQLVALAAGLEADLKAMGFQKAFVWVGAGQYMTGWHVCPDRTDSSKDKAVKTYAEARAWIDQLGASPLSPAFAEAEVNSWLGALQHVC